MACEFNLSQITEATSGRIISQVDKTFIGVGTDTRESLSGQIFVALKGDRFDAHNYLADAVKQGAKCLIVHGDPSRYEDLNGSITIVQVEDTLRALQDLARHWRKRLKAKIIGITGSNGKTTTKEFTAAILESQFKVHRSQGSFNNHWGVPLTLLSASQFSEAVILEMGMNHPGELAQLSKIASPDVVVCTTVARAHIGFFDGSIQAIADAKEEIYLANANAFKIFNYDNEFTHRMFERVSKLQGTDKVAVFSSFSAGAEVSLRATLLEINSLEVVGHIKGIKGQAKIPVFGRQNVVNLMAAASIAVFMGMEPERIWAAMPKCKAVWGRNQLVRLSDGQTVLFDGYNANPDSVTALIKNLFEIPIMDGKKIFILGEMLELGNESESCHREIGEMIGNTDVAVVWFMGASSSAFEAGIKASGYSKTYYISNTYEDELAKKVGSMLNPSDIIVIKGSRGMKMEQVLKAWDPHFANK